MNKISKNILFASLSLFLVIVCFFYSKVLYPFYIGAFIAYLLDPTIDYLEKKKISRNFASSLIIILFFGILLLFSVSIIPIIAQQTIEFLDKFPNLVNKVDVYISKLSVIFNNNMLNLDNINLLKDFHNSVGIIFKNIISKIFLSSVAIINILSLILITPIVSWYFLKDWDKIRTFIINNTPTQYKKNLRKNLKEIDSIVSSFLRGQFSISIILGVYYTIAFYIIGLDYSLFLGVFSGIFTLIPYFGIIVSLILSIYITVLQFMDVYYSFYILLVFFLALLLENYFLSPRIVGEKLGLHPLTILFAVFLFGSIFGVIGIFFAIPITSILFLYYKKFLTYLNSNRK